ncbi:MAG TPA: aconitate hydratase AcnA [Terricaulis sp.]|nr:aconitate hydratase AcnA [Terricaulis sp.]
MTAPIEPAPLRAIPPLAGAEGEVRFVDLAALDAQGLARFETLPYCLRVVLENAVRNRAQLMLSDEEIARVGLWAPGVEPFSIPLLVSRVILPDSSGAPALIDLAALRSSLARAGVAPEQVEPRIPVDLVVDHSLIVEEAGHPGAALRNSALEYERNGERYSLLKWAQSAFSSLRVAPPGIGIVHQVHIERLARVIDTEARAGYRLAFPEFVLGGDSHTPMVGALGVFGWGVGGIEAEAAMLGQPYMVRVDRVVGVKLIGRLPAGATATDLVLTVTEKLRHVGVVGQFVEFFGEGARALSVTDRATLANMAPEYGATIGYFPIDDATIAYLRQTGREDTHIALIEAYARAAGFFRAADAPDPAYSEYVEIDVSAVSASVAGPRRPQDRLPLQAVKHGFEALLAKSAQDGGFGASESSGVRARFGEEDITLRDGAIAIAAITSCTNTSNPNVMLGAGLIAQRAVARGLTTRPWVKTSLAPGSRVVTRYLERAGLLAPLEALGFHVVGYGCTTCSGKSGPLAPEMARAIEESGLVTASVLSGNRNFDGRIHRLIRANYIMSPMLVVAYALAGRVDIDLTTEPLGVGEDGAPIYLADLWPSQADIQALALSPDESALYRKNYADMFKGDALWRDLEAQDGALFGWADQSTYILEPPFYDLAQMLPEDLSGARVLGLYDDFLTTDHISPAGEIPKESEAGRYLSERGVPQRSFNAYTQRRGNHEVMARGAFANPRIRNLLAPDHIGGVTRHASGEEMSMFAAAARYRGEDTPLIVLAGKGYGMGSSRDWAAKGTALLGVRAVIAEDYERIHRSNLVALGVAPLQFLEGESWRGLGLSGEEEFELIGLKQACADGGLVRVRARGADGVLKEFSVKAALDSAAERACLAAGGMFATIKQAFLNAA